MLDDGDNAPTAPFAWDSLVEELRSDAADISLPAPVTAAAEGQAGRLWTRSLAGGVQAIYAAASADARALSAPSSPSARGTASDAAAVASVPELDLAGEERTLILVEDADVLFENAQGDGESSGVLQLDRGFLSALRDIASSARCPIVLSANSLPSGKLLDALRGLHCRVLAFAPPAPHEAARLLASVLFAEQRALHTALPRPLGDMRATLLDAQAWSTPLPAVSEEASTDQSLAAMATPIAAAIDNMLSHISRCSVMVASAVAASLAQSAALSALSQAPAALSAPSRLIWPRVQPLRFSDSSMATAMPPGFLSLRRLLRCAAEEGTTLAFSRASSVAASTAQLSDCSRLLSASELRLLAHASDVVAGGQTRVVPAPLDVIPAYWRG